MIGIFVAGIVISLDIVRTELIKNTTQNTQTLGANISDNLDRRIDSTMTNLSTFILNPQVLELIIQSNNSFDNMDDISHYMESQELQWRSYDGKENPMYNKMLQNPLSQKLETFREIVKESSNIDMFPEIYIVNKYGATIAENSRTTNWDQSNKLKFQNSKLYGSHIEDLHYDTSAGIWALGVALGIYDGDEFVGMIKTAYAIEDINQLITDAKNEADYNDMKVNVFTSDGRYIFVDGINHKTTGDKIDNFNHPSTEEGSHIVNVNGENQLIVHTISDGFRNFPGLGWIISISISESDFMEPINAIQNILIVLLLISVGVAIIMSVIMVRSIVFPILKIKYAADEIADGDFEATTGVHLNDEIGVLADSIDSMAIKLHESQKAISLREELIVQKDDILLQFSDHTVQCCVCIIDIISSTRTTAHLSDVQINDFYGIFVNEVNKIIKKFNGVTVKNLGDGLLFYFPKMNDSNNLNAELSNVIDCCLHICSKNNGINILLEKKDLVPINYKLSITYGSVSVAKVTTSVVEDIFGGTVNTCAKINHHAKDNGVVIDGMLYELVKDFPQYKFKATLIQSDYKTYSVLKIN